MHHDLSLCVYFTIFYKFALDYYHPLHWYCEFYSQYSTRPFGSLLLWVYSQHAQAKTSLLAGHCLSSQTRALPTVLNRTIRNVAVVSLLATCTIQDLDFSLSVGYLHETRLYSRWYTDRMLTGAVHQTKHTTNCSATAEVGSVWLECAIKWIRGSYGL